MKKIVLWLAFIVGIIAVIGACSKSDDESSTAATTSCAGVSGWTEATSCSGTASGSITGIDNITLSGTYSQNTAAGVLGWGVDNSTGCVDNTTLVSGFSIGSTSPPTGTNSMIYENIVVTSSSSFATNYKFYSDTSCQTEIATLTLGYTDFTVGDNVTGLTTSVGSNTYPSSATKVSYKQSCTGMKASTDAGATFLTAVFGSAGVAPTVGTTHACSMGGDTTNAFMKLDNQTAVPVAWGLSYLYWDDDATSDWTTGVSTTMSKQ